MNSSTANLPLPSALGGSGPRVGAPERPSTANGRTKEWVNPLDVHFGKEHTLPPAPAISIETSEESPLRLESGTDVRNNGETFSKSSNSEEQNPQQRTKTETTHSNGYPSPPQSVSNADQTLSPVTSNLCMVNGASPDPASLPSPAASATRTSEEGWDVPVIRNVLAKRDTTTFHSPRRRSFTMDLEEQELEKLRKQRQTEGFAGSFADFDFGETVTKQASIEQFPEPPVSSAKAKRAIEYIAAAAADERDAQPPLWSEQQSGSTPTVQDRRISSPRLASPTAKSTSNSPQLGFNPFVLPHPGPVDTPRPVSIRPETSYSRIGAAPAAATGAHPGNAPFSSFEPPPRLGFRARLGSDASSRRKTNPPKPLVTSTSPPVQREEFGSNSGFFGPPDSDGRGTSNSNAKYSLDVKSLKSPLQKPVLEGDFPVSKGLPRGRQPPRRPARSDEAQSPDRPDFSMPNWGSLDRVEPRHSAMPPPLATSNQPRRSVSSGIGMAIPSPSFASLELSISTSSESLTQAFEEALEKTALSPGLVGDFFAVDTTSPTSPGTSSRVEATKAPPRPAPVTLSPSSKKDAQSRSPRSPAPTQREFNLGFI